MVFQARDQVKAKRTGSADAARRTSVFEKDAWRTKGLVRNFCHRETEEKTR